MNVKLVSLIVGLCILIDGKNVILTPKQNYNTFNHHLFSVEHNLEHFMKVDDLMLYKTDEKNYDKFINSFTELFDMEIEQEYKVNPVHESDVVSNVIFVQNENQLSFKRVNPWHLDRVTKPVDYDFSKCHNNKSLTINTYIIDTGVDADHPEFEGRAKFLENFTGDNIDTDANGHGTHCSGLVGSRTFGVCKDARLFGVKVLDANGSGSTSNVLRGMEYVFNRHKMESKTNNNVRSIISMSLGGGYSLAINRMAEAMLKDDTIYFAAAAGNENSDSCNTSPASAKGIFTVMAMDKMDNRAYFSNFGKCADMYSPGVDIESTIPGGNAVFSGTSMACPILVGVLNHYVNNFPYLNMKGIKEKMLNDAIKNDIKKNPNKTPNLMVHLSRFD